MRQAGSLGERGVACWAMLWEFGFISFVGCGGRWWERQQGKLKVLVGWQLIQPGLLLPALRTNSVVIPVLSGGEGR